MSMDVAIRPLDQQDLPEADRIFRLAFGTFFGLPDPMSFGGDAEFVKTRWRADPTATLGAYIENALVGSNFAANWGSFGFFGPLTVRPDLWDHGVAQRLLAATMRLFELWGTRQAGLFTVPQSPKHIALYQKFGFWPQYLTPLMGKPIEHATTGGRWSTYAEVPLDTRDTCLANCRAITDAVYPGLDVQREIQAVAEQALGETILIHHDGELVAFAICHVGGRSEASTGTVYVKFGAARPGQGAALYFDQLLSAAEALAAARGNTNLIAGVNAARHDAYRIMIERGFRTFTEGVAMQRPNEPGYNRPDCFVIDDWR
jgi:GNAT superfamily N-acetyltransferase